MLAKKPLTDRGIAVVKAARRGKRTMVWDAVVPGLAVRVTDNAAKSFVLVTRYPGSANPAARAIGKVGAITLEDARDQAREWLKLIATGIDPAHAAAKAEAETLRAVCEEYQARHSALRSATQARSQLERLVYPTLGSMPILSVRRGDIVRLHDHISDANGAVVANRVVELLRRIFNWWTVRNEDFRSPIVRGMTTAEASRDRILTDEELRAIWRATDHTLIDEVPNLPALMHPAFCGYVRFLLLTAARRTEAAEMRWTELAGSDWTLPAVRNKTGQELIRPLSRAAFTIVEAQPQRGGVRVQPHRH